MTEEEIMQAILGIGLLAFTFVSYYLYQNLRKAKKSLQNSTQRIDRVHESLTNARLVLEKTGFAIKNKIDKSKADKAIDSASELMKKKKLVVKWRKKSVSRR